MAGDRRTEAEIRGEIASEREHLADALADLRASIAAKRRPAAVVVGVLAAAIVAVVALRVVRRLERD